MPMPMPNAYGDDDDELGPKMTKPFNEWNG
jgi:hypothetical protein